MPFLLLLSAILSALTGVVGGSRPVDVQIARQLAPSEAQSVVVPVVPAMSGHAHLLGAIGDVVTFATLRVHVLPAIAAPRLYLGRLRA